MSDKPWLVIRPLGIWMFLMLPSPPSLPGNCLSINRGRLFLELPVFAPSRGHGCAGTRKGLILPNMAGPHLLFHRAGLSIPSSLCGWLCLADGGGWLPAFQGPEQMIDRMPSDGWWLLPRWSCCINFQGSDHPEIGDGELFNHTSWEGGA